MISQLCQNRFFPPLHPAPNQKQIKPQNPFSIFLKVPSFRGSKATHLRVFSQISTKRLPLVLRREAQRVLMDYFHSTRGYSFLDAEFISKSCPRFIEGLVAKVDDHDDVARSLRKLLRYNPINEFEPFFESLGISPSELHLVLPTSGMIFLDYDDLLLDNFHALWDYGIPRNRIGKIYKEAKEVFGYPSGLLLSKFQAYEDLGLSRSAMIKLFVCCPPLLVGDINGEFVNVLDWLKKVGIEIDWIVNHMSCSRTYNLKRMLDNIQFLHKVGFSEKHIYDLLKPNPKLLLEGFGKKLYSFLSRSYKMGLEMNMVCSYLIEYPHILSNKCAKNLLRVIDFLYFIGMEADDIAHILSNHMHVLSMHSLKYHQTLFWELKLDKADLCQIIKNDPLKLISMASKLEKKIPEKVSGHDPHKHLEKTTFLLKLGYAENSEEMAKALKMFHGRGDELQERFDCLVEAGLDYNSVIEMIKRTPTILNRKKDVIEKKIDFLRNILGYPVEYLVVFPSYFCHDLEKILERFLMYVWLKERKAVKPTITLSTIVASSDKRFVKCFVNAHPQGPTIWKSLKRLPKNGSN